MRAPGVSTSTCRERVPGEGPGRGAAEAQGVHLREQKGQGGQDKAGWPVMNLDGGLGWGHTSGSAGGAAQSAGAGSLMNTPMRPAARLARR